MICWFLLMISLIYTKVEAGKIDVQLEHVVLNDLLIMIEQKFIPIANDKKIQFNLIIDEDIPKTLLTDGQRVKQIINNLLSNAFKFTSTGEINLIVNRPIPIYNNELKLNKTIMISVIDSGIGIPKEKQKGVFEAFQQADGSTSRRYGGTGLGLSISRQLANLLGGELTLISDKNKGSTFNLYLPEHNAPQSAMTDFSQTKETPLLTEEYRSPTDILLPDDKDNLLSADKTILIIEDDHKFFNILRDLAHKKGFKCLLAEDGITGLKLATENKPSTLPSLFWWINFSYLFVYINI